MENFVKIHETQLQFLGIPDVFVPSIQEQLQRAYVEDDYGIMSQECIIRGAKENFQELQSSDIGSMIVIPYLCTWDMTDQKGLWDALSTLSVTTLQEVYLGLQNLRKDTSCNTFDSKDELLNEICAPTVWSRVMLYRKGDRVRAALSAPPFLLQMEVANDTHDAEADLSGPFPFEYRTPSGAVVDCALAYVNPNRIFEQGRVPTIDFVPLYTVSNVLTRCVRYAALLGNDAPSFALQRVKEIYASFVHQMHLVSQRREEAREGETRMEEATVAEVNPHRESGKLWKVYTDSNDPMHLSHPEAGLSKDIFVLVDDPEKADIIYSYKSLFLNGPLKEVWEARKDVLINQFPYEGAFVQKDHLGRETLKQYGLPRPSWAVETYDLDVQLGEFVGSALLESDRSGGILPVWIIKPANGTQSQGHVVTRSLAQVLRLVDSGGVSRVAQRYIENPICYQGRKVDCRCLVMMTSAKSRFPSLYLYNRVYFRIAGKAHSVTYPSDLVDNQSVLTAMHLVKPRKEMSNDFVLPIDTKTIAQLEMDYADAGFRWEELILPKVKTLIRELLTGMSKSYPAMGENSQYRALYGVDVMFSIEPECVEPKLTEVSFCPANNAICDAYERNEHDYRNYNTDIFKCLFLGEVSSNITRLQ